MRKLSCLGLVMVAWGCGDDSITGEGGGGASATASVSASSSASSTTGNGTSSASGPGQGGGGSGQGGEGGSADCVVDDLFCNGIERIVDGACVKVPADPCDDGEPCTTDVCDEDTDRCSYELAADDCASCFAEACDPDCDGRECGDDGCGATCGDCDQGEGCASVSGQCQPADQEGTCADPIPIDIELGTTLEIEGDSSTGLHQATPTCNSTSTAVETIYTFTLTEPSGVDVRTYGYDTVLHIRSDCDDDAAAATVGCSDDSSPPGDYGSRVAVLLDPGTYFLIVDGFDSTQFGPYQLSIRAEAGCAPQCDGYYCGGDDGCGGDCGTCDEGFACSDDFRCRPDPCIPDCTNDDDSERVCGDDGCEGTCGTCEGGSLCVLSTGSCETFAECDHLDPACEPACEAGSFCGSDCACHSVDEPLPDLVIDAARLENEVLIEVATFDENSCAVAEGCVGGEGERRLLRFSVEAVNQGQVTLTVPPPADRPDLFQFSPCHGHFHFDGFAEYALLDREGEVIVPGRKQAYCMEDTEQVLQGPNVPCNKLYSCDDQGIQPGWSDLYGNALDCQWLDITDVDPGDYQITVTVNPNRAFEEMSFENNTTTVNVNIPAR